MKNPTFVAIMKVMGNWRKKISTLLGKIGPGFITGAADDDPSGIATYSIAGAQYGYRMNWMSLFLLPAMVVIQEMCGRIGLVTGKGLASVIKTYYSKKLMWFAVTLLAIANIINIGADMGIIAASLQMLFGFHFYYWLLATSLVIVFLEIFVSYKKYSEVLKWLGLSLFVYVITAFLVKQDWLTIAWSTLIPRIDFQMDYLMTMVGFLGTTISPYLFFWQASEEVEERIYAKEISDFNEKAPTSIKEIKLMRFDTKLGMAFSNMMTFFVVITTAATLNANGIISIETPQQAAMALRPLAGEFAYILFAVGMIGIGLQAVPVLAGSLAYAVADGLGIEEGLSKKFSKARGFYMIIFISTAIGALMNVVGINTIRALYLSAIVNGVISVPLIFIIMRMANNEMVIEKYKTGKVSKVIAWMTFVFMAFAVVMMVISVLK